MKRIYDLFYGVPMTAASGVFLLASLALLLLRADVPFDPAWATIVISGFPLVYLALTRLFYQRWISSALLISIAMAASIAIGEIFAAGEVAFIMALGGILEDMTVARVKRGVERLLALAPRRGRVLVRDGDAVREEMIPAERIRSGDVLRVLPGEAIPADGTIVSGDTSLDQSIMTGESLPVDKGVGDDVFCGTINAHGSIDVRATHVGADSSLQKLIRLVREAEEKKAPMQRIVDRWATWLVPIALGVAVVAYFATSDIVRAVTVLVVFCPCALALATPTSVMAAIGQATKHGVLIKSGEALEKMGNVDCIAFDKTGTLTLGKLEVGDIAPVAPGVSGETLLKLAAAAEKRSEHPLGKAIVRCAEARGMELPDARDFRMLPGKGVAAEVDGARILCGNVAYLAERGVSVPDAAEKAVAGFRAQGKASILVASGETCLGAVALSDAMRPTAPDMVAGLRNMGTEVVLLTGDHETTARHFAERAGIRDVHADLLPAGKLERIRALQATGKRVCMIGDGVNDAPSLKAADVGVAMGSMGSDIAIEAADIALMGDDIDRIPYLKRLSDATIRTIKGNIAASMAINFVAVALSVAGVLTPVTGALVHNAGSVLVVLNAALLYDRNYT